MKLSDIMDTGELWRLVDEHYITQREHPSLPLAILNYTAKTQFNQHWTNETELCRGLIFNYETGEIVARSFRKFFNIGERPDVPIPDEPFSAYQKLDGCLGISYIDADDLPSLATRGSFLSEQAQHGTAILRNRYPETLAWMAARPTLTLCFELILPEYRIVVDYEGREDLVLLAAFEAETGSEQPISQIASATGFPVARIWDVGALDAAVELVESPLFDGEEGVVVRFRGGLRLKIKRSEYMRLHRIITGLTPRRIWQMLKDGSPPIGRLFAGTPAGFQEWARSHVDLLESQYRSIETESVAEHQRLSNLGLTERKDYALQAATHPHAPVLFKLLDGKPYGEVIWKRIKPEAADPYRVEV